MKLLKDREAYATSKGNYLKAGEHAKAIKALQKAPLDVDTGNLVQNENDDDSNLQVQQESETVAALEFENTTPVESEETNQEETITNEVCVKDVQEDVVKQESTKSEIQNQGSKEDFDRESKNDDNNEDEASCIHY